MKIGFLGLGKMGSRMAEKLLREGHDVVVWNRSKTPLEEFKLRIENSEFKIGKEQLQFAGTIEELVMKLEKPRVIWSMLPAGEATESVLEEVSRVMSKIPVGLNEREGSKDSSLSAQNDIIIDGGNAFFKDTQRRYDEFVKKGVGFLGIGVSGGVIAFEDGYPLMVGGDVSAYQYIKPILDSLAKPGGGHEYFGEGGAGHFVKMVHNGIEYGIMQALGEGFGVMEKSPYNLDLLKIAELYQRGTLVSGFMLDRAKDALEKNAKLDDIEGVIDATGEADWTVTQGKEEGVFVENIDQSLDFRRRSKTDKKVSSSFAARMVAALRREFGGHAVKKK